MKTFLVGFCFALIACASTTSSTEETHVASSTSPSRDDDDLCLVHHFKGDYASAQRECTSACDASMKDSCKVLGDMYERGEGVSADPSRAEALHAKACRLGDAKSCVTPAPAANATEGSARLSIGSIDADGVRLANLSCENVAGGIPGGIFGGIALAAGFKTRKAAMDACGARTDERVAWTGAHGAMTRVKATGGGAGVDQCIERALDGAPSTITGTCSAVVRHF